jgi:hypothetical protein
MVINVEFQDEAPSASPLQPFILEGQDAMSQLPLVGDQITNGQITRKIKGRVFEYAEGRITVTLLCDR